MPAAIAFMYDQDNVCPDHPYDRLQILAPSRVMRCVKCERRIPMNQEQIRAAERDLREDAKDLAKALTACAAVV